MRQAGLTRKVAISGIKGGGAFWIHNLKRFEHPYGGNCTARHRARTHSGTSNVRRALRLCAHLIGYAQGEKGVFETLEQEREECEAGLAAWTRLITGTEQGMTG